ncbi:GPP34 family phosphoprotein [Umezawaea endophytica]|uniref:GPP34 family phosphoprotein n=1 Tax=Umezawaea endophytica TaxID=1654476 RepID=A0A9X2VVG2_9PSEU|nr:GPP34 family phosphoprotein [Umezawaea endophytica]MCS7483439.1 GPP34 family phosphoprotein [Umezawaea endophytica]
MPTLAEDLLLLLLDDDSGRLITDGTSTDRVLAGAVLVDLVNAGRVAEENGKLHVMDTAALDEPVLEAGLARLVEKAPAKPQRAVEVLAKHVRETVLEALAGRGLIRQDKDKVLGLFPRKTWPAVDSAHEDSVRAELTAALVGGERPGERAGALISLLHAIGGVPKVVEGDKKALKARAAEISDGDWAGVAVKKAVQAVQAAVTAAIVVASTAGTTSS